MLIKPMPNLNLAQKSFQGLYACISDPVKWKSEIVIENGEPKTIYHYCAKIACYYPFSDENEKQPNSRWVQEIKEKLPFSKEEYQTYKDSDFSKLDTLKKVDEALSDVSTMEPKRKNYMKQMNMNEKVSNALENPAIMYLFKNAAMKNYE